MRKPFIAANWKLQKTVGETEAFINTFLPLVKDVSDVEILLAPPFTSLAKAAELLKGTNVELGGQNVYWEEKGAFTGEIAPSMLLDIGCSHAIIGHSERRQYFGETDETVNKRIKAARQSGLEVIFCVGETNEERESNKTLDVLKTQLDGGLQDIADINGITIAYEPVWAIGTGKTATPEIADDAHSFIRGWLKEKYSADGEAVRIQYGGSVKPGNVKELMGQSDIDGALVGGASLDPESFSKIVLFNR